MSSDNKHYHFIFTILLSTAFLLVCFLFVTLRTQGDTLNSSADVINSVPTLDTVFITTSSIATTQDDITLTENTVTNVFIKGTYTDNNGCDDVATSSAVGIYANLYRSGISRATNCSADNSNCYQSLSCEIFNCTAGGSDTTGSFLCTSSVYYYADPTDSGTYSAQTWLSTVTTTDKNSGSIASTTGGVEMNSLVALGIGEHGLGGSIGYGQLALGATSGNDSVMILRNTGNVPINPQVSGTDLTCAKRIIDVSKQKYATTTGVSYGQKTSLSTSPAPLNICMSVANQSASSTTSTFWMIQLPTFGVAGNCDGVTVVNADSC